MTLFLILGILSAIVGSAMVFLAFLMILIFTVMTVFNVYYSFVKRAGLLFGMFGKLKKVSRQKLGGYEKHNSAQNSALRTKLSSVAFQESLALSRRDSIVIFCVALIMLLPYVLLMIFGALNSRVGILFWNFSMNFPVLYKIIDFVFQLWIQSWEYIVCLLPVVLIFHAILYYGVRKTVKKLEKFA